MVPPPTSESRAIVTGSARFEDKVLSTVERCSLVMCRLPPEWRPVGRRGERNRAAVPASVTFPLSVRSPPPVVMLAPVSNWMVGAASVKAFVSKTPEASIALVTSIEVLAAHRHSVCLVTKLSILATEMLIELGWSPVAIVSTPPAPPTRLKLPLSVPVLSIVIVFGSKSNAPEDP